MGGLCFPGLAPDDEDDHYDVAMEAGEVMEDVAPPGANDLPSEY
jgi:hypothetical protein